VNAPAQVEALRARLRARGAAGFLTLDPEQQRWFTGFRASDPLLTVLLIGATRSMLLVPERARQASEHACVDCVKTYDEQLDGSMPGSRERLLDALLAVLQEGAPVAVDEQRLPIAVADRMRAHGHEPLPFNAVLHELLDAAAAGTRRGAVSVRR